MSKVKVAIIGCGGIANQKHFPALKNNSDLNEIVAFCDIKIERAQKAAAEFGVAGAQVTADYREVLANPAVEVVHICTPNVSHSEIAIAAFEAKKHVYCEKPMSHSIHASLPQMLQLRQRSMYIVKSQCLTVPWKRKRWWRHGRNPACSLR